VARPFDRSASLPAAGELDRAAGQFWVGNPWDIVGHGHNLSGFERNRAFLNLAPGRFADMSFLTGTDSDGDGRSVFGADIDGDGMQDLIVRQASIAPLLVFQNKFPKRHYLRVSLRGTKSNGLGVGARITAEVAGRRLVRELFPANTYMSQQPCEVHFGLGDATKIDRLTIRWPSGLVQELSDVAADQFVRITEGVAIVTKVGPNESGVPSARAASP
jgi:hypothetical protein